EELVGRGDPAGRVEKETPAKPEDRPHQHPSPHRSGQERCGQHCVVAPAHHEYRETDTELDPESKAIYPSPVLADPVLIYLPFRGERLDRAEVERPGDQGEHGGDGQGCGGTHTRDEQSPQPGEQGAYGCTRRHRTDRECGDGDAPDVPAARLAERVDLSLQRLPAG